MRYHHFKVLVIIYLILISPSLKMASSKPKHVAMFCQIVYKIKLCYTKIILLFIMRCNFNSMRSCSPGEMRQCHTANTSC